MRKYVQRGQFGIEESNIFLHFSVPN